MGVALFLLPLLITDHVISDPEGYLVPVCLLESDFFLKSEFRGKWILEKWIPRKWIPMFGSVMENELKNNLLIN